jgi:maleylpyruvate isomerase
MEWLEERFPTPSLLPSDQQARAIVRSMAAIVACDIHPLNNLRVLQHLRTELEADEQKVSAWIDRWMRDGFQALERLMETHAGAFAFGAQPTLADCCLAPQVYSAERFGVSLADFPNLRRVTDAARAHPAFAAAHPDRQPQSN